MLSLRVKSTVIAALLLTGVIWTVAVNAEVIKKLRIESSPSGAEVFLLRGSRKEKLGTTPISYKAEFHSKVSILRMAISKPGYDDKKIDVSAKQSRIKVKLDGKAYAATSKTIGDPGLRALQGRLKPAIERVMPRALTHQQPFKFDVAGAVHVLKIPVTDQTYLWVPMEVSDVPKSMKKVASGNAKEFLRGLWIQLGDALALPLGKAITNERAVEGVLLVVDYGQVRGGFEVGVRAETRYEMQCRPGVVTRSVYDNCASRSTETRRYGNNVETVSVCKPGFVMRQVNDPCATRVPVARTEFKADPRAVTDKRNSRAIYILPHDLFETKASAEQIYPKINALLTDENGKALAGNAYLTSILSEQ